MLVRVVIVLELVLVLVLVLELELELVLVLVLVLILVLVLVQMETKILIPWFIIFDHQFTKQIPPSEEISVSLVAVIFGGLSHNFKQVPETPHKPLF